MVKITKQMKNWSGNFGKAYTDRNALALDGHDRYYKKRYNVSRTALNRMFIGDIGREKRILEVGSNVGNQLLLLQREGFKNLYGIELNRYAVTLARKRTKDINIIHGSAFDIPFKDKYFEVVFTSGLLIHIAPSDIGTALKEIHRCAKRYIWGFEYYAAQHTEVVYRKKKELLWKANFPKLYLSRFSDLNLIKEKYLEDRESGGTDVMFLLKKRGAK